MKIISHCPQFKAVINPYDLLGGFGNGPLCHSKLNFRLCGNLTSQGVCRHVIVCSLQIFDSRSINPLFYG